MKQRQTARLKDLLNMCMLLFFGYIGNAQVFNTNVIVKGSLCVGTDCVTDEEFGTDTQIFKENNLRILFEDTSGPANFPGTDWRITINDDFAEGKNYFAIDNVSGNRRPFLIQADAKDNGLVVDGGGRIGIGTEVPVRNIHMVGGDSPTIRLDQDGSSGFTEQIWDLGGNESEFFITDGTNGFVDPFSIQVGAPNNALRIFNNGNVGIGNINDEKLSVLGNIALSGGLIFRGNISDIFSVLYDQDKLVFRDAATSSDVLVSFENDNIPPINMANGTTF